MHILLQQPGVGLTLGLSILNCSKAVVIALCTQAIYCYFNYNNIKALQGNRVGSLGVKAVRCHWTAVLLHNKGPEKSKITTLGTENKWMCLEKKKTSAGEVSSLKTLASSTLCMLQILTSLCPELAQTLRSQQLTRKHSCVKFWGEFMKPLYIFCQDKSEV